MRVAAVMGAVACLAAATTAAASESQSQSPQQRSTVQTAVRHAVRVMPRAGADGSYATVVTTTPRVPTVRVDRRAYVTFTVSKRTTVTPFYWSLPAAAGHYVAFYFPATHAGFAAFSDAGSTAHWPVNLLFGRFAGAQTFYPRHRYVVAVATERASSVQMPAPMHIVSVRHRSWPVTFVMHQLPPLPTPATAGWAATGAGHPQVSTTAIVLDWADDVSPADTFDGDACPTSVPAVECSRSSSDYSYIGETLTFGPAGGPRQVVLGEGFNSPRSAAYVSGNATNLPTPFTSATLYAFSMDPR